MTSPNAIITISDIKTDADLRTYVAGLTNMVVKKITETGEYRVNYRGGHEDTAYYTDDRHDAAGTALSMERN